MTNGQKNYWMNKSMDTYEREIDNATMRFKGLKIQAKDAMDEKNPEKLMRVKTRMNDLRKEMKKMYEELEVIRSEHIRVYGTPAD